MRSFALQRAGSAVRISCFAPSTRYSSNLPLTGLRYKHKAFLDLIRPSDSGGPLGGPGHVIHEPRVICEPHLLGNSKIHVITFSNPTKRGAVTANMMLQLADILDDMFCGGTGRIKASIYHHHFTNPTPPPLEKPNTTNTTQTQHEGAEDEKPLCLVLRGDGKFFCSGLDLALAKGVIDVLRL